jgi:hypothetical protein
MTERGTRERDKRERSGKTAGREREMQLLLKRDSEEHQETNRDSVWTDSQKYVDVEHANDPARLNGGEDQRERE